MILVERDAELAAVRESIDRVATGSGGVLLIDGPAGIGKSALLEEAKRCAVTSGLWALTARGASLESEFPYGIVRQLFGRALRRDDPALEGVAEAAAIALGLDPGTDRPGPEEHSLLGGLFWMVVNLAERSALALIVDDLHWADAASLRFLLFLARRLADLPVVVIGATRDVVTPLLTELRYEPATRVLALQLLTPAGSAEFVRAQTEAEATSTFEAACHTATGGNPHLLRELLVALRADGLPPDDSTANRVPSMSPTAVSHSVLLRLASLHDDATRLAHAVAILGEQVELRHAAALAGLSVERAVELVDDLERISLLAPGRPLDVVHPLIGQVIRNDMRDSERRGFHRRAARLLRDDGVDVQLVAAHLDGTDPAAEAWAAGVLEEAARQALRQGDPGVARRWLNRALAEGVASRRAELLAQLGEVLALLGEPDGALAALREAVDIDDDPDHAAAATILLARVHVDCNEYAAGQRVLEAEIRRGRASQERLDQLHDELAWHLAIGGHTSDLLAAHEQSNVTNDVPDSPQAVQRLVTVAQWHMVNGDRARSAELALRAIRDPTMAVRSLGNQQLEGLVTLLVLADMDAAARGVLTEWLDSAARAGSVHGYAMASGAGALLEWHAGDLPQCVAMAHAALESGAWPAESRWMLHALEALVLVEVGDAAEALAIANQALSLRGPDGPEIPLFARARAQRAAERLDDAYADLQRIAAIDAARPVPIQFPRWRLEAAECALARGDRHGAEEWLAAQREYLRTFDTPSERGAFLRVQALVNTGQERVDQLTAAVAVLAESVNALDHARALVDLGAAQRAAGAIPRAQDTLRQAADHAHRCGAARLVARARQQLEATGARPRRTRITGVDALTPAERRVATLAANDPSNVSVAQSLFLTRSTVEKHLTSVYRKLNIASRSELATALGGEATSS